jgi:hypothetical protein
VQPFSVPAPSARDPSRPSFRSIPQTALRLTTALYYTPSGTSIQGTGIKPDIRVEQPVPEELRGRVKPSARANLRGHIQGENEDEEGSGSIAYVPPDPKDDVQLGYAMDLLRGERPIRPSRPIRIRRDQELTTLFPAAPFAQAWLASTAAD